MIKKYYNEQVWFLGMPQFNQLPSSYIKKLDDSMAFNTWKIGKIIYDIQKKATAKALSNYLKNIWIQE